MVDPFLLGYFFEAEKIFPPNVRESFAKYVKRCDRPDEAESCLNFEQFFNDFTNRCPTWEESRVGFTYDGPSWKIRMAREFVRSVAKFLATTPNFLDPYEFSSPPLTEKTASKNAQTILKAITESGEAWILQTTNAQSNDWFPEAQIRVCRSVEIFRLKNKTTGSFIDFYANDKEAHFLIFKVAPENENKFWVCRKDFTTAFNLMVKTGIQTMSATVLTKTSEYPLASKEWRTSKVKVNNQEFSRLALFWRRLGFVTHLDRQDSVQEAVVIVAPNRAMEIKKVFEKAGRGNPYVLLSRSVYDPELERELKGDTVTLNWQI